MTCAFMLAPLFFTHRVQVWHILSLSFIVGVGQSFGGPAIQRFCQPWLGRRPGQRNLHELDSVQSCAHHRALLLEVWPTPLWAPHGVQFEWCFLYRRDHLPHGDQRAFHRAQIQVSVLKSMKEGIKFIRDREGLAPLVVLAFCTTLFGFSLTGFLPVIVRTIFRGGPGTYELLLVCSGAGSISGALMVAATEKLKGQGRAALFSLFALGVAIAAFAFSRRLPLSCVLIFLAGAAVMASASLMLSLVQLIVADSMRGRVMSVYNLAFGGNPIGGPEPGKADFSSASQWLWPASDWFWPR